MQADTAVKAEMGIYGHPNATSAATPTSAPTTAPSLASAGRPRTSPSSCSPAKPTTSRWASPTRLFPQERDETPGCLLIASPNDTLNFTTTSTGAVNPAVISDIEAFANFMRMLAPPTPAPDTPSTMNGRAAFLRIGCAHCHHPSFTTGKHDRQRLLNRLRAQRSPIRP